MTANMLQGSLLLSPNDDEVRMWRHPFASRFDGTVATLISRATLYVGAQFIYSYACSSYNSFGPCSKRFSYFGAPTGRFSVRRKRFCLVVESIPSL